MSCHGSRGQGGVGPPWTGLAGSTVRLSDGSTVVADDAYLAESIRDPAARRVSGYSVQMPRNNLDAAQISSVVAYIDSLAAP